MAINTLHQIVSCPQFPDSILMKAIFQTAFYGFFRISNIVPHVIASFYITTHFAGAGVFFQKKLSSNYYLSSKKTMQLRDEKQGYHTPKIVE